MTSCIAAPMRIRWYNPDSSGDVSGIIGSPQSKFYITVLCSQLSRSIRFEAKPIDTLLFNTRSRPETTLCELQQAAQRLWDEMWFSLSDYDFSTTNTPEA